MTISIPEYATGFSIRGQDGKYKSWSNKRPPTAQELALYENGDIVLFTIPIEQAEKIHGYSFVLGYQPPPDDSQQVGEVRKSFNGAESALHLRVA